MVTTLEYGKIETDHPQLRTVQPQEFAQEYLDGRMEPLDGMVTFSSVEHSGLGRYGDELNPYGDLIAMARAWYAYLSMESIHDEWGFRIRN